ncbi:hypothetical protein H5U98_25725 [Mycolicibacterium boenickei]|uniref:DUF559 domain-containing protein n=1 Tax=Mycolicibacterium boenickei TaxID=146017 RepID=A0AAX2ZV60_9MYCO|nr:hypothetical protein [Mycolicibacterium boenickei]PEG58922.1 hypothetical protein CQY21_20290 [Mycolicibacterium boenickei]UNB98863.1 hypothetical protein H5U98_25725 [Mycolicibacterium boenickei]BBX88433.1 hypothetical protein MBOE_00820 [Mycolicibacterium boenickei]
MNTQFSGALPGRRPGPFLDREAIRAGLLTKHELETKYRAVYRNVYLDNEVTLTPLLRAQAAWLFAGPDAVVSGLSAAAVYGTEWLDADAPAEIVRANRHAPAGLRAYSYALEPDEVCEWEGMRVTTVARTAFDLGRLLPHDQAVPILDALLNKTGLDPEDVWSLYEVNRGMRGVEQLRMALVEADGGAETPLETRTRLVLRYIGIPGFETQIPFFDTWGMVCNRVAMGWRRWKVAIECDEERDGADYRRWMHAQTAELESFGWSVVWVTQSMVSDRPGLVSRVRQKLLRAQRQAGTAR